MPLLEPVRAALGVRRDDDLVSAEGAERVLDRLQRVGVADLAPRVDARAASARRLRSSRSWACACAALVRDECRSGELSAGETTSTFAGALGALADRVVQLPRRRRSRSRPRGCGARRPASRRSRRSRGSAPWRLRLQEPDTPPTVSTRKTARPAQPSEGGGEPDRGEVRDRAEHGGSRSPPASRTPASADSCSPIGAGRIR